MRFMDAIARSTSGGHCHRFVKSDAVDRYDLSYVTRVHHSGSRLSVASCRAFTKLLPKTEMISGYGNTEFGSKMSVQTTKSPFGLCGQLKVIEPDTGRILGPNQKGEVLLKSASMMSFSYNDPQGAAKIIDPEGWLHSGDLGYCDKTGEIFIVDRMQDAIRFANYDLSPFEIESVILSYPGVKEVAVVGQERPQDDELLIAFVVRTEDFSNTGKQVTGTDIVDLVASKLQDSRKHLQGGVRFIDQIPRTATGKNQRVVLRDMARSMVTI